MQISVVYLAVLLAAGYNFSLKSEEKTTGNCTLFDKPHLLIVLKDVISAKK